jgi:hypothetical protein
MYNFWIGSNTTFIGLDGVSQVDPVKGYLTSIATKGEAPDVVEDLLTVYLEDRNPDLEVVNPPSIVSVMTLFEFLLKKARLYFETGLGEQVVLHAEPVYGEVWESQVVDGWTEFAAKGSQAEGRLSGSMVLTVHVRRVNYWQSNEIQLNTSSPAGKDYLNGCTLPLIQVLTIANAMFIYPDEMALPPDLPSPLHFQMQNLQPTMGNIYVAQNVNSEQVNRCYNLDDVDATGPSTVVVDDATYAFGGHYKNCSFTGPGPADLLVWPLAQDFCQDCAGNFFRFMFRLGYALPYSDFEFKVQVRLHSTAAVVGETSWTTGIVANRLQLLGSMRLPPYQLTNFGYAAALDLALMARRYATGIWTVAVDYLQLIPIDGWREYDFMYPLQAYWKLNDDAALDLVTTFDAAGNEQITHIAKGQPFYLAPHIVNAFHFAWLKDDGYAFIDAHIKVSAFVRVRRRLL